MDILKIKRFVGAGLLTVAIVFVSLGFTSTAHAAHLKDLKNQSP